MHPLSSLLIPNFNSIKVRLEPEASQRPVSEPVFQFHKGTIRTLLLRECVLSLLADFNSIKVRLEPSYPSINTARKMKFQFHKGTIRTNFFVPSWRRRCRFQFHKGTIRTAEGEAIEGAR